MNYRILEAIGVENTNIDGAEFNNLCTGGESGIVKGVLNECDFVGTQNAVIVSKGLLVIKGIRISIEDGGIALNGNPAEPTKFYLIAYVVLSSDKSVSFGVDARTTNTLIQDDLYKTEQGRYEIELGYFTQDTNGMIVDCVKTCKILEGSGQGGGSQLDVQIDGQSIVQNGVANIPLANKVDEWDADAGGYFTLRARILRRIDGVLTPTTQLMQATNVPKQYLLATYNTGGILKTNTPKEDLDCVNLQYFNTNKGTRLWAHEIELSNETNNIAFMFVSFDARPTVKNSVIKELYADYILSGYIEDNGSPSTILYADNDKLVVLTENGTIEIVEFLVIMGNESYDAVETIYLAEEY